MRFTSLFVRCFGFALFLLVATVSIAQSTEPAPTLKSILLEQLKGTHNHEDWFVPAKIAV